MALGAGRLAPVRGRGFGPSVAGPAYRPWNVMDLSTLQAQQAATVPGFSAAGLGGNVALQPSTGLPRGVMGELMPARTAIPLGPAPSPLQSAVGPNPAMSRSIRGGWAGAPAAAPTGYTPTALPQQLALPPGQPLPPPPAATLGDRISGIGKSLKGTKSLLGDLSAGSGSWTMGRGGATANMVGGLAAYAGADYLHNAATANQWLGGDTSPQGRILEQSLAGTRDGALLGPKAALANGLFTAPVQAGLEQGNAIRSATPQNFSLTAPLRGMGMVNTGNAAADVAGNSLLDTALSMNPITGLPSQVAKGLGLAGVTDKLSDLRENTIGKLPGVGSFFGGGGEEKSAAPAQPSLEEQKAQLASQYNVDTLGQTMTSMNLAPEMQGAVLDAFEREVAWQKAGNRMALDPTQGYTTNEAGQVVDKDDKVVKDPKTIEMSDEEIVANAWNKAYQGLPALAAQQTQNEDFFRKQAAMQAALVEQIPQYTQPFYEAANGAGSIGEMLTGLRGTPYGDQFATAYQQGMGRMGDATAQSLASYPGYLAMQQQSQQNTAIANQIQNAQLQQQLAAQLPGLFGQQQSSGSGVDQALAEALAGGGS